MINNPPLDLFNPFYSEIHFITLVLKSKPDLDIRMQLCFIILLEFKYNIYIQIVINLFLALIYENNGVY
jgi:hypothetical protein